MSYIDGDIAAGFQPTRPKDVDL